jgi:hypothetical protein
VANGPAWLRAVMNAEQAIGDQLARATNSREAADAMLLLARGAGVARGAAERGRSIIVHALALPSRRDVQLLDAKVERLQRALEDLAAEARDMREDA